MYAASTAPIRSSAPRIGEWLSEAFNLFGQQWQVWCLQGLIYMALGLGPALLGVFIYYGAIVGAAVATSATTGSGASSSSGPPAVFVGSMLAGVAAMVVGVLVSLFTSMYVMAGMKRTAVKQLRGEPISARDIFSAGDVFWPILGASLLTGLLAGLGAIFCYVPGLLIAGMLSFTLPIIVEERIGVIEAMQKSWEATKPHMWMYLVWYLLLVLIMSVGSSLCYIGMIASVPIYTIALMIAYRDVFGIPGAIGPESAAPVAMGYYGPAGPPTPAASCRACGQLLAAGAVVCPQCGTSQAPRSE
jgi:uncharacterized membrane protein